MDAEYAQGVEPSPYIDLKPQTPDNTTEDDSFELDPTKVCRIDDPDCEACQ